MKAIVYTGQNAVEMRDLPIPAAPEGWALIHVSHAGICGSDVTIFLGAHPRAKAPLIMGHEFSGRLMQDIPGMAAGTLVTVNPLLSCGACEPCRSGHSHVCKTLKLLGIDRDGGMAEYAIAPIESIVAVPEGVSAKLGAFIEPIAVAVHALHMANFRAGYSTLVFGAGAIGLATAVTLRRFGAGSITICEPNPVRLAFAQSLGFHCVPSDANLLETLLAETNGDGYDYVFDCAGHQSVAEILPDVVKIRGVIEIIAGYKKPPCMNFQKGMFKEFSIQFTRVYTKKDFEIAARLSAQEPEYERLINYELAPEQAAEGFALMTNPSDAIKVMYRF
ncbi:MAG: alcohol dehydrogenase catalytic domain-containing protein [Christensenella sp.]|nr:alcohol dehydrogenase catalytic domain-containing protein [Christensenella sp.]